MKKTTAHVGVLLSFVMILSTNCLFAQDWPQWRGPNRDNVVKGFTVPKEWPKELAQKWKTEVGLGDASPSLVGDKLFVFARQGDEETMICLDAKTGQILWQEKQPAVTVTGGPAQHSGPRSTPTVVDGKVCALGVGGILSCWDANTGQVLWRKDSKEFSKQWPMFFTSMSPIVVDGMCIAHLGGEGNGAVVAYNLANGEEKWRWSGEGPSYGSPNIMTVAGTKQVVLEAEKSLVGIAVSDGRLLWQTPIQSRGAINGTPLVDGETLIYTGQGTIAIKIEKQGDTFNVEQLWSTPSPSPKFSIPVVKNGFLYCVTSTGNLYCMNAKTGEVAWTDTTRRGDPAAILDVGPVLLALTSNSELAAFEPNGKEYVELARIKVGESPTWSYPVVAGNRVFVKDRDSVILWTIE